MALKSDILELSTTDFPRKTVRIDDKNYQMRSINEFRDAELNKLDGLQKRLGDQSNFTAQSKAINQAINMVMVKLPVAVCAKLGIGHKIKILDFFSQLEAPSAALKSPSSKDSTAARSANG